VNRHLPGFVSASTHASLDGAKVITYAQWESQEALTGMLADPAASQWLRKLPRSVPSARHGASHARPRIRHSHERAAGSVQRRTNRMVFVGDSGGLGH